MSESPDQPSRVPRTPFEAQVLHVAGLVRPGEWSTFADISRVVAGDDSHARVVGAAIRRHGVRPHSRVLDSNGRVPTRYMREATSLAGDQQPLEPGLLRSYLENEGVRFNAGRADPAAHVDAAQLIERLREQPYPESVGEAHWTLNPGDTIRRTELHARYGGGRQGGIAPSRTTPNVLIFTDPKAGTQHGYIYDGWDQPDPTLFRYTGEGQQGDQRLVAGNRTILDHVADGRALRVFKGVRGLVQYLGEFKLDVQPYETRRAPASGGGPDRDVIVFRLRPEAAATDRPPRQAPGTYRRATPSTVVGSDDPFYRDPNQLDRALKAHADVQNELRDFLAANGAQTWSPVQGEPEFDLAWIRRGTAFVAEVKSLRDENEDRQLRLGPGSRLSGIDGDVVRRHSSCLSRPASAERFSMDSIVRAPQG